VNISVDDLGPCKKLIRIEIDEAGVKEASDTVIAKYQTSAQLPGFRKGKAPRLMIISSYRDDIEQQVKSSLMDKSLKKAIADNEFRLIAYNDVEVISFDLNGTFSFSANIEVEPQFEVPEYKGIELEAHKVSITEDDVTEAIDALRQQRGEYVDADGPTTEQHLVVIDYKGTIDGKPIAEAVEEAASFSERQGQWIKLDDESFLPGFQQGLLGKNKGEDLEIETTFPDEFAYKDLSGKTAQFQVTIQEIKSTKLPELNDEFAKSFEAESVEKLKEGVKVDLEAEAENQFRKEIRGKIIQHLSEGVDFEVPQSMADETTKRMVYDIVYQNQQAGVSKEQIEENTDEIYTNASASAIQRVQHNLILMAVARKENIQVSQEELSNYVVHMASTYNIKPDKLVKDLKARDAFPEIVNNITLAKTIELIQSEAKITEIETTKAELEQKAG